MASSSVIIKVKNFLQGRIKEVIGARVLFYQTMSLASKLSNGKIEMTI